MAGIYLHIVAAENIDHFMHDVYTLLEAQHPESTKRQEKVLLNMYSHCDNRMPQYLNNFEAPTNPPSGSGSVVGIATFYGLDGPGIEFRWGRDFPRLSRPALRPTQPPVQWVPGLSRGLGAAGA